MIYATGDTHGNFQRFGMKFFPEQRSMARSDYMIICGDFGGLWDNSKKEKYWLDWLEDKPFTTLFVDGNHENFELLNSLPKTEWHGGNVHVVRPHILHLTRGQVFEIDGYTFFTMGGASSHDISDGILDPEDPHFEEDYWLKRRMRQMFRVKGVSWWPEELPNDEEYREADRNLSHIGWKVDYIITHCAPTSIVKQLDSLYAHDRLTEYHQKVKRFCDFHYWLFGHYHDNRKIDDRFILLWEQMVQVV